MSVLSRRLTPGGRPWLYLNVVALLMGNCYYAFEAALGIVMQHVHQKFVTLQYRGGDVYPSMRESRHTEHDLMRVLHYDPVTFILVAPH